MILSAIPADLSATGNADSHQRRAKRRCCIAVAEAIPVYRLWKESFQNLKLRVDSVAGFIFTSQIDSCITKCALENELRRVLQLGTILYVQI